MASEKIRAWELGDLFYEEVEVTPSNAPRFFLNGHEVDIWSKPYSDYCSKSPIDYVRERILEADKRGEDPFPDIVGKAREKELVKQALLSGSPILLKGRRGYGKTTFSKAITKLLPERILTIKGCKIHDDPTRPTCFSCKKKVLQDNEVELAWVPTPWIRIPGDPMLTTRQLIGGISIQKIREGYDLDDPQVFIPGRALKANRGVGYFDELGAIPTALQTLLHELLEEHQVTTSEGDIVPFKISTIELASTNPANYRGTNPIKEPLLDRMEEIEIGPPESLEEEIEIGKRNMYLVKVLKQAPPIPSWHLRILARTVRFGRDDQECPIARKIQSEPSCRATIKLFDHLASKAIRNGRRVPLLSDYGEALEVVELALLGRIEVEYGAKESKREIIRALFDEALKRTLKEIYEKLPEDDFDALYRDLYSRSIKDPQVDEDGRFLPIDLQYLPRLKDSKPLLEAVKRLGGDSSIEDDEVFLSGLEIILQSISFCTPNLVERRGKGYIIRRRAIGEEGEGGKDSTHKTKGVEK